MIEVKAVVLEQVIVLLSMLQRQYVADIPGGV